MPVKGSRPIHGIPSDGNLVEQSIRTFMQEGPYALTEDKEKKNRMMKALHNNNIDIINNNVPSRPMAQRPPLSPRALFKQFPRKNLPVNHPPPPGLYPALPFEQPRNGRNQRPKPPQYNGPPFPMPQEVREPSYLTKISHWRNKSAEKYLRFGHRRQPSRGPTIASFGNSPETSPTEGFGQTIPPPPPAKDPIWQDKGAASARLSAERAKNTSASPRLLQNAISNSPGRPSGPAPQPQNRVMFSPPVVDPPRNINGASPPTRKHARTDTLANDVNDWLSKDPSYLIPSNFHMQQHVKEHESPPFQKSPKTPNVKSPRTPRTPKSPSIHRGRIGTRSKHGRSISIRKPREPIKSNGSKKWSKAEADLRRKRGMGMSITEQDIARYRSRGLPSIPGTPFHMVEAPASYSIDDWVDDEAVLEQSVGPEQLFQRRPSRDQRTNSMEVKSPTQDMILENQRLMSERRKSASSVRDDFRMESLIAEDADDIIRWLDSFKPKEGAKYGNIRRKPVPSGATVLVGSSASSRYASPERGTTYDDMRYSGMTTESSSPDFSSAFSTSSAASSVSGRFGQPSTPPNFGSEASSVRSTPNSSPGRSRELLMSPGKPALARAESITVPKQFKKFSIRIPSIAELPAEDVRRYSRAIPTVHEEHEQSSGGEFTPNVDLSLLSPPAFLGKFSPFAQKVFSPQTPHTGRRSSTSSDGNAFRYDIMCHRVEIETDGKTAQAAIDNALNDGKKDFSKKKAQATPMQFRSPMPFTPRLYEELKLKGFKDFNLSGYNSPLSQGPKTALVPEDNRIIISNNDLLDGTTGSPIEMLTDAVYRRPSTDGIQFAQIDELNSNESELSRFEESDGESDDSGSHWYDSSWEYPSSESSETMHSHSLDTLKDQIEAILNRHRNASPDSQLEEGRPSIIRLSTAELRILAGRNSQFPGDILFGIMKEDLPESAN